MRHGPFLLKAAYRRVSFMPNPRSFFKRVAPRFHCRHFMHRRLRRIQKSSFINWRRLVPREKYCSQPLSTGLRRPVMNRSIFQDRPCRNNIFRFALNRASVLPSIPLPPRFCLTCFQACFILPDSTTRSSSFCTCGSKLPSTHGPPWTPSTDSPGFRPARIPA